jgi:lipoprotein Spr
MTLNFQKNLPLFGCIFIIIFTSCSSTKNLSAVGASSGHRFIDGIEVRANSPASKHTTRSTIITTAKTEVPDTKNTAVISSSLQTKYAAMLNTTPSQLHNEYLLQEIDEWYGTPYRYGGTTKWGIDCSAFSQTVMQDVYNETLPRTAQEQFNNRMVIGKADLQEGDLVFFHTSGRKKDITHVGVYLANNKFIHASLSGGISIADLNDPYWKPRFRGAGRHS